MSITKKSRIQQSWLQLGNRLGISWLGHCLQNWTFLSRHIIVFQAKGLLFIGHIKLALFSNGTHYFSTNRIVLTCHYFNFRLICNFLWKHLLMHLGNICILWNRWPSWRVFLHFRSRYRSGWFLSCRILKMKWRGFRCIRWNLYIKMLVIPFVQGTSDSILSDWQVSNICIIKLYFVRYVFLVLLNKRISHYFIKLWLCYFLWW